MPYNIVRWAIRLVRPEPDVEATYKIAGGLVVYLVCWVVEGWILGRLAGAWAVGLFVALLGPSGFFALGWTDRVGRMAREARRVRAARDRTVTCGASWPSGAGPSWRS